MSICSIGAARHDICAPRSLALLTSTIIRLTYQSVMISNGVPHPPHRQLEMRMSAETVDVSLNGKGSTDVRRKIKTICCRDVIDEDSLLPRPGKKGEAKQILRRRCNHRGRLDLTRLSKPGWSFPSYLGNLFPVYPHGNLVTTTKLETPNSDTTKAIVAEHKDDPANFDYQNSSLRL